MGIISLGSQTPPLNNLAEESPVVRLSETDGASEAVQRPSHLQENDDEEPEGDTSQNSAVIEEIRGVPKSEIQAEIGDDDSGWLIALRKGVRACRTNVKYPISHYVKYEKLSQKYRIF